MRSVHGSDIPDDASFRRERELQRRLLGNDHELRRQALELQVAAGKYAYTYNFEWLGIPVIRLPEDIVVLQEIVYDLGPKFIVETGVARGGGVVLAASLMSLCGLHPVVLGLDIQIFPHAWAAVEASRFAGGIRLVEADSASVTARQEVRKLVEQSDMGPAILILDSNHSHDHVLRELRTLATELPVGSVVIVADTLIEEMPSDQYKDRPWSKGSNPATAVSAFLDESCHFRSAEKWSRRALVTENRYGIIERIS